jgi:hypothetical protein
MHNGSLVERRVAARGSQSRSWSRTREDTRNECESGSRSLNGSGNWSENGAGNDIECLGRRRDRMTECLGPDGSQFAHIDG